MRCWPTSADVPVGNGDWSEEVAVSGVRVATRRLLSTRVSVAAVVETAMWLAIPYVTIGLAWAFFHFEEVRQLEGLLQTRLPAGAAIAAIMIVAGLWPAYLVVPAVCMS